MLREPDDVPRFKAGYHVRSADDSHTIILTELSYVVLESRLLALLSPWIDGIRTVQNIVEALNARLSALDIAFGLNQLEERGYIEWKAPNGNKEFEAFCHLLGISPEIVSGHLNVMAVAVRSAGDLSTQEFEAALRRLGIRLAYPAHLTAVLAEDYLHPELACINRDSLANLKPWLMVKPVGVLASVGPLFQPGRGPCWRCFAERIHENPELQIFLSGEQQSLSRYSVAFLPSTVSAVIHIAATELLKYYAQSKSTLTDTLIVYDSANLTLTPHRVLRREGCPDCDTERDRLPRPVHLEDPYNVATAGARSISNPKVTFTRLKHHISPITGIVTAVEPLQLEAGFTMKVSAAGHNFGLRYGRRSSLVRSLGSRSFGRGLTRSEAQTGALCEALERYSGCWRGYEPLRRGTFRQLGGDAIHPANCLLFSDVQYHNRDAWNEREGEFNWIPQRFDDAQEIDWVAASSLCHGRLVYLPAALCYYNYVLPEHHDFCRADSNGNAAGTHANQAILHGLLEVIERDAVSIWWYNCAPRPAVDLEGFPGKHLVTQKRTYEARGRSLWALDITTNFGIPVFVAISCVGGSPADDLLLGFGCHLDPGIALTKACTELNQALVAGDSGSKIRVTCGDITNYRFLLPDTGPARTGCEYPKVQPSNVRDDIQLIVRLARNAGLDVLVLNQTRGDVGLSVVKVIIPGMRHIWARFAPGRLYDIPVQLRWADRARTESELNPAHLIV
jgi:bacteriocin biosynthesis cyclodehydratase domain-containing protein